LSGRAQSRPNLKTATCQSEPVEDKVKQEASGKRLEARSTKYEVKVKVYKLHFN